MLSLKSFTEVETLVLDVTSEESIAECKRQLELLTKDGSLDMLINNAGASYQRPIADLDIDRLRQSFELNVISYVATTQALLPMLIKASSLGRRPLIVNHTSQAAVMPVVFMSAYAMAKAATAMFTDVLRLEIEPFGVHVVELRSGWAKSNIAANRGAGSVGSLLPDGSIYSFAKDVVEKAMSADGDKPGDVQRMDTMVWAERVAKDLLKESPPRRIEHGQGVVVSSLLGRQGYIPSTITDGLIRSHYKLDRVAELWKAEQAKK